MVKKAFVLIILFGLVVSFLSPDQKKGIKNEIETFYPECQIGKQYLVLIAIDRYKYWQPLQNPVKDAKEIKVILTSRYHIDNVTELYNERATKKAIIKLFRNLQDALQPDDSLLIFYSGHGHLDKLSKNGFWIPMDGGKDKDIMERWIPNSVLKGIIRGMKSKHILIIADSCFSGDLLQTYKGESPEIHNGYFKKAYSFRCRQALTSGSREFVPDNSEFARQLKLALTDNTNSHLDTLMLYNQIRLGMRQTIPLCGEINGTDHQLGASFLFFLRTKSVTVSLYKKIEEKAKRIYRNSKGYNEAIFDHGITMVHIPAGEFIMGSKNGDSDEIPVHSVFLDEYWIGKYEITFEQYDKFCHETGKKKPIDLWRWGRGKRPVIYVSWDDSREYCQWISKKIGIEFDLPTEAQWEKAARGIDGRLYPWGNNSANIKLVNYRGWVGKTTPVGAYPQGASPYGLMDMAGNVWDWCLDRYDPYYYRNSPPKNPAGPDEGEKRNVRGGSAASTAKYIRSSNRDGYTTDTATCYFGFRLAISK
jgi:formylglycine-generating enzyme required for sulfatase activity